MFFRMGVSKQCSQRACPCNSILPRKGLFYPSRTEKDSIIEHDGSLHNITFSILHLLIIRKYSAKVLIILVFLSFRINFYFYFTSILLLPYPYLSSIFEAVAETDLSDTQAESVPTTTAWMYCDFGMMTCRGEGIA